MEAMKVCNAKSNAWLYIKKVINGYQLEAPLASQKFIAKSPKEVLMLVEEWLKIEKKERDELL